MIDFVSGEFFPIITRQSETVSENNIYGNLRILKIWHFGKDALREFLEICLIIFWKSRIWDQYLLKTMKWPFAIFNSTEGTWTLVFYHLFSIRRIHHPNQFRFPPQPIPIPIEQWLMHHCSINNAINWSIKEVQVIYSIAKGLINISIHGRWFTVHNKGRGPPWSQDGPILSHGPWCMPHVVINQ